jgi:hypothetical protein
MSTPWIVNFSGFFLITGSKKNPGGLISAARMIGASKVRSSDDLEPLESSPARARSRTCIDWSSCFWRSYIRARKIRENPISPFANLLPKSTMMNGRMANPSCERCPQSMLRRAQAAYTTNIDAADINTYRTTMGSVCIMEEMRSSMLTLAPFSLFLQPI